MIIVKLQGGLGNQMFQYAAGRSLAHKYNTALYLDHSFLERNDRNRPGFSAREYELGVFDISAEKLTSTVIDRIFDSDSNLGFDSYVESPVTYDRSFENIGPNVYMDGYWHSYLYFTGIRDILLKEFSFKDNVSIYAHREVIDDILTSNSISIHLRRGDYVNHPLICLCPISYYIQAIKHFIDLMDEPRFFIFCDDPNWAVEHLKFPAATMQFVSKPESPSWLDIYLMSICKHNIIANSTFSWWAAWLNNNNGRKVIAPKRWFHQKRKGINVKQLCLQTWTLI